MGRGAGDGEDIIRIPSALRGGHGLRASVAVAIIEPLKYIAQGLEHSREKEEDDPTRDGEHKAKAVDEEGGHFRLDVRGVHQLHLKGQRRSGWDGACGVVAVAVAGRDSEDGGLANEHLGDPEIPTEDDLGGTKHELERLPTSPAAVKDATVFESACVMHLDLLARLRLGAVAWVNHLLQ